MRSEWRKARALAVSILLMLIIELSMLSLSAAAGPFTEVSVDMDDLVEVEVGPGSKGIATINGIVTCQTANPTQCIVSLSPTSTVGTTTIDKPNIVFQGGGIQTRDIEVGIVVPMFTNASESESSTVHGTWQQGGTAGQVQSDITQVIILPFYRLTIFSENPVQEIGSGETTKFPVRVQNTGNCPDTYTLKIANREELKDKGINIECINVIPLDPDQSYYFDITVKTYSNTPAQRYEIYLSVTSQCSEADSDDIYEEEYPLILRVETFQLSCKLIQALSFIGIAAAIIVTGVFVYIKKFKGRPLPRNVELVQ
jgi:hypothetical protein